MRFAYLEVKSATRGAILEFGGGTHGFSFAHTRSSVIPRGELTVSLDVEELAARCAAATTCAGLGGREHGLCAVAAHVWCQETDSQSVVTFFLAFV